MTSPSGPGPLAVPPGERKTVVTVDPGTDRDWRTLVLGRDSDVFQSPAWMRAISQTYGFDVKARVLMRGSEPVAGLPFAFVEGLGGLRAATLPFSDYCDPIVSSIEEWRKLTAGVLDEGLAMTVRCLHNRIPLADDRFEVANRARWHGIDLAPEGADPWDLIDSSARRAVRRSRRSGVEVTHAETAGELRAFYDLHLRTRKYKYRLLAQPYAFFENLWREFVEADAGTLMLARLEGEVVAGVFFLEWKDRLYYKFNASHPAISESRPNDAIMWAGIAYGRERSHRRMDLGLSDWDQDGLVRYKRKYASEEKTISFLSHVPPGANPSAPSRLGLIMPRLTELLTDERVPDAITERAAATLYRYFA